MIYLRLVEIPQIKTRNDRMISNYAPIAPVGCDILVAVALVVCLVVVCLAVVCLLVVLDVQVVFALDGEGLDTADCCLHGLDAVVVLVVRRPMAEGC